MTKLFLPRFIRSSSDEDIAGHFFSEGHYDILGPPVTDGVDMQTNMSTDRNKGFFGNLLKAAGRVLTGESFFITTLKWSKAFRPYE